MVSRVAAVADGNPGRARAILLGDAHPLFRSGMQYLLQEALSPVDVVEAGSRRDALGLLEQGTFDLVLTSLFSAEGDWDGFLADLLQRAPSGRLLILSSMNEPTCIFRILAAGAAGFLLKETPPKITLHAIRLVLDGGIYVPPAALTLLSRGTAPESSPVAAEVACNGAPVNGVHLTDRQQAVLRLIVQGASNKAIARSLDLSAGTVKGHVANLLRLYGAENRTELVNAAARRGGLRPQGSGRSESPPPS